ncbi:hypothetical protein [Streptomyces sp. NPDC001978]|uniref:hypothetical protein n=1 Tax=Streptomyces sp. NPDC001978 TaxID=3364627 RepID=UPI00369E3682
MEQRTGASSKPSKAEPLKAEPVTGAGFDPAFIPGITAPAATEAEAEPQDANPAEPARAEDAEPESAQPEESAEESAEDEKQAEGPVFEAADRRAKIVADGKGVRLSLDEESCEFSWDEIGAVETESPRFGKRFTVTVHTPDRRWYPIEIEATSRARFAEWESELDAVLDAYFETD